MAGPVPTYLATQTAAQSAFTVPFGLISFVNAAIAAAVAAGEFNVTVDCSLFVTEDVSNLRIYLDSLGYKVDFAKDTNNKSLNIDWGRFQDIPGTEVIVDQGTTPWIVSGTVAATQSGPWTVSLTSGSIEIGTVDQGTPAVAANAWPVYETVGGVAIDPRQIRLLTASDTVTTLQGTSPWVVSGTISTSPDVNVHDGAGNTISSTGTSLDVNVTDFPASQNVVVTNTPTVNQGTSPWVTSVSNFPAVQPVSGTITALQGTSPWVVSGAITTSPDVNIHDSAGNALSSTGTSLNVDVTNTVPVTGPLTDAQLRATPVPISGTVTANLGTVDGLALDATLTNSTQKTQIVQGGNTAVVDGTGDLQVDVNNFPATTAVTQSTSPWIVSGTITTSPNVNVHDGTGVSISSTGSSLNVDVTNTVPVTGTFFQAIQPIAIDQTGDNNDVDVINGTGAAAVNIQDGGNTITVDGTVAVSNFPATVAVTQSTSPWVVSGTVTANVGTTGGLALDATLTNSSQKTQIVQGGNTAVVDAAGDLQVDVNNFPATQTVAGTVTANQGTSPWVVSGTVTANAGSGNFTVVQPTGTNLHTVLDSGTLTSITNALPTGTNVIGHVIADTGSTTVVTGNVTVVQPTGTNLHTVVDSGTIAATQSGTWTTGRTWTLASGTDSIAAVQSGTWTVQPGNTPNTSPWLMEQRAPGTLASYAATTLGLVAALTPTDIFTLYGSGTKTIKIIRIEVSATQNTAAIRDIVLVKRSAANSGGTSTAPTIVPYDSNNTAATATVLAYTANPASLGASVGNIRTSKMDIPATNLVGNTDRAVWTFGDRPSQAIVLRGTSQGIAINLNSVTSASNSFDISIEWTEE